MRLRKESMRNGREPRNCRGRKEAAKIGRFAGSEWRGTEGGTKKPPDVAISKGGEKSLEAQGNQRKEKPQKKWYSNPSAARKKSSTRS